MQEWLREKGIST
ncbi:unnamed protein product [Callosobruchus maculatus]|uniref:Uncharacterized protein n=1 Tax=Callosobruchus maculatus TaxID=64391 RepID=A0A653DN48_CALMS|nr:unnamed protein product [Callosobruchus maculatus]